MMSSHRRIARAEEWGSRLGGRDFRAGESNTGGRETRSGGRDTRLGVRDPRAASHPSEEPGTRGWHPESRAGQTPGHFREDVGEQLEPQGQQVRHESRNKGISRRRKLTQSVSLLQTLGKKRSASCHSPREKEGKISMDNDFHGDQNVILEGPVELTTSLQTQSRYMFLYPDALVLTKPRSTSSYRLKLRIRIREVWIASCLEEVSEVPRHPDRSFVIGWPTTNMVATFINSETKDKWLRYLTECIAAEKGQEIPSHVSVKIINRDTSFSISKTIMVGNTEEAAEVTKRCVEEFHIKDIAPDSFQLWVISDNKVDSPYPLIGHEHPYSIRMKYLRDCQSLQRSRFSSKNENQEPTVDVSRCDPNKGVTFQILHRDKNKRTLARKLSWDDSEKSAKKLSPIARILKITSRRPNNQRRLFGRDLQELWQNGIFCAPLMGMLHHLYQHGPPIVGIFRKSASCAKCREVKARLDSGRDLDFDSIPVVVTASLLKELLRNLPNCLLTCSLYDEWIDITTVQERKERNTQIHNLLQKLPLCNRKLLLYIVCILLHISDRSRENHMTLYNLSVCFSQSLLWPDSGPPTSQGNGPTPRLEDAYKLNVLVHHILEGADEIFGPECRQMFGGDMGTSRSDMSSGSNTARLSMQSRTDSESLNSENAAATDSLLNGMVREHFEGSDADSNRDVMRTRTRYPRSEASASYDSGLTTSNPQLYDEPMSPVQQVSTQKDPTMDVCTTKTDTLTSRVKRTNEQSEKVPSSNNNKKVSQSSFLSDKSTGGAEITAKQKFDILSMLSFSAPNTPHYTSSADILSESDHALVSRFFGSDEIHVFKDSDQDESGTGRVMINPSVSDSLPVPSRYCKGVNVGAQSTTENTKRSKIPNSGVSERCENSNDSKRVSDKGTTFERRLHAISCPSMFDSSVTDLTITDETSVFDLSDHLKGSSESVFDDSYVDDWTKSDLYLAEAGYLSQDNITSKSLYNLPSTCASLNDDSMEVEEAVVLRQKKSQKDQRYQKNSRQSCYEPIIHRRSTILEKSGMTDSGADLFPAQLRRTCLSGDFSDDIGNVTIVNVPQDSDVSPKISPIKLHSTPLQDDFHSSSVLPSLHDSVNSVTGSPVDLHGASPQDEPLFHQPLAGGSMEDQPFSTKASRARPARPPSYEEALVHKAMKQGNLSETDEKVKQQKDSTISMPISSANVGSFSRTNVNNFEITNVDSFDRTNVNSSDRINVSFSRESVDGFEKTSQTKQQKPTSEIVVSNRQLRDTNKAQKPLGSKPALPSYEQACQRVRSQENLVSTNIVVSPRVIQQISSDTNDHHAVYTSHQHQGSGKAFRMNTNRSKSSNEISRLSLPQQEMLYNPSRTSSVVIIDADGPDSKPSYREDKSRNIERNRNQNFQKQCDSNLLQKFSPTRQVPERNFPVAPLATLGRSKSDSSDVILRLLKSNGDLSNDNKENIRETIAVLVQRRYSDSEDHVPKNKLHCGVGAFESGANKSADIWKRSAQLKSESRDFNRKEAKRKPLTLKDHDWHQELVEQYSSPTASRSSSNDPRKYSAESETSPQYSVPHNTPVSNRTSRNSTDSTQKKLYTSPAVFTTPTKKTESTYARSADSNSVDNSVYPRIQAPVGLAKQTMHIRGSSFQQRGTDAHGGMGTAVSRHQSDVFQYVRPQLPGAVTFGQSAVRHKKRLTNSTSYGRELDPRQSSVIQSKTTNPVKQINERDSTPRGSTDGSACYDRSRLVYDYCNQDSVDGALSTENDITPKAVRVPDNPRHPTQKALSYSSSLYGDRHSSAAASRNNIPTYRAPHPSEQRVNVDEPYNRQPQNSFISIYNSDASHRQKSPTKSGIDSHIVSSTPIGSSNFSAECKRESYSANGKQDPVTSSPSDASIYKDRISYYSRAANQDSRSYDKKVTVPLHNRNY